MKRLRILTLATLTMLVALHGCQKDLELNNIPSITDKVETAATFATITGTIECAVATKKLEVQVYQSAAAHNDTTYAVELSGGTAFELRLKGLKPKTSYNYKYIIYSDVDSAELKPLRFTTNDTEPPTVETAGTDSVMMTTAVCLGNVTNDGGIPVTARGICYSTTENPTIDGPHTTDGAETGPFSTTLTGLAGATTYYVRAYATNDKGTGYGQQITFTTHDGSPKVSTSNTVANITTTSAVCGGTVILDYGYTITERGVCWSTTPSPTIADNHTSDGTGTGTFTSALSSLTDSTTYYFRAYATNEKGTGYGQEYSFRTLSNYIGGHKYVDLGLPSGLKWATCNLGANHEWDQGNYYAWGETETKEIYSTFNCLTTDIETTNISSNPNMDAATAHWGHTWRMPTTSETLELMINCTREWVVINNVGGCRFTGPNGNSIFIPAAGRYYENQHLASDYGFYWTGTAPQSIMFGSAMKFDSQTRPNAINQGFERGYGCSIRPVSD